MTNLTTVVMPIVMPGPRAETRGLGPGPNTGRTRATGPEKAKVPQAKAGGRVLANV